MLGVEERDLGVTGLRLGVGVASWTTVLSKSGLI